MLRLSKSKSLLSVILAASVMIVPQASITAFADEVATTSIETQLETLSQATGTSYKDNFYDVVNATTFASHEIPATSAQWSWFGELSDEQDVQMEEIFNEINSKENYGKGTPEQKLHDLYELYADTEARNADGLGEFQSYLDAIVNSQNLTEYVTAVMSLSVDCGYGSILPSFGVSQDDLDSTQYVVVADAGDSLMGKDYYETEGYEAYIELYNQYLGNLLVVNGFSEADAQRMVANTDKVARDLASVELERTDYYDIEKIYNVYTEADIIAAFPSIDMASYMQALGFAGQDRYLVPDEDKFAECASLITEDNLQVLKDYSATVLVSDLASITTQTAYDLTVELSNKLNGITEARPNEYYWMAQTAAALEWNYGLLYTDNYCSEEAKKEVTNMITEIIAEYKNIIGAQTWMSDATKQAAIAKLDTLQVKVGYPDDFSYYLSLEAPIAGKEEGGSLTANTITMHQRYVAYELSLLGKPVDKTKWIATPQTINAFYDPANNGITILAGIMQDPFYNPDASEAANLGAIGVVIGHEISHAFDSSGSQYDANGNYNPWWTEDEYITYTNMCQDIIDYYDVFPSVETGSTVDGALTITENIADLGGMYAVTQIIGHDKDALQEAFVSYANMWAEKMTYEYASMLLMMDVHSPGRARVNAVLSSMDAFYEAFDIQEGDGMYVAPEDRVGIWK